jgi:hypothetical protein
MVGVYLNEGYSLALLSEQFKVSGHSFKRWVKAYRVREVEGLAYLTELLFHCKTLLFKVKSIEILALLD